MKTLLLLAVILSISACGPEFENKASHVFNNAGGIIRGSKEEVGNQWQTADTKPETAAEKEERLKKERAAY